LGDSTNGSVATQFSSHRPYSDPSVATSTFMVRLLLFGSSLSRVGDFRLTSPEFSLCAGK
ncbi:MAG TPA: hypothetical protein VK598_01095, partial [Nitrospiraceae bacterium]|nr:hypothetical protein [Nitrospiraceae bacterium]